MQEPRRSERLAGKAIKTDASPPKLARKRKSQQKIESKGKICSSSSSSVLPLLLGAHVSIGGGLHNAVHNAIEIGATAFGLFLRSQRQWQSKPLADETVDAFTRACAQHGFDGGRAILPHGSYLLNLGSPDESTLAKSRDALVEEMTRCERLGIGLYNFHPGSTCGKISIDECIRRIAESLNLALSKTRRVVAVIENMSGQGHMIGGDFREIRRVIDLVQDKSRVGVCLDTCHAFAAGYDISCARGYDEMMDDFQKFIGFEYLRGMHLNDSKAGVGSHLDRHENIGRGKIGREGFRRIVNDVRLRGIPMILETPMTMDDEDEILLLRSLAEDQ